MKLIILDHLRRWWWVWVLGAVLQSVLGWACATGRGPKDYSLSLFAMFLGPFLLQFDMQRGFTRALVTLPLTARKIAHAWWLATVGLPAGMLALFAFLSLGITHLLQPGGILNAEWLAMNCFISLLFLGTSFLVLMGFSTNPGDGWWHNVRNGICGGLWGASIGGWPFISKHLFDTPTKTMWALIIGTGLTVIGWFRAERMVAQRAGLRPGVQPGKRQPGRHQAPSGFGGLPFLCGTLFVRVGRMALVFVGLLLLIQILTYSGSKLSPKQLFEASLPAITTFGYFFAYMFLLLPTILQLRLLRTLPVSTSTLAATLVLLPAAPILVVGLAWSLFGGGVLAGGNAFQISARFLACAAMTAIGTPLFVWQGLRFGSYVFVMLLVMVSAVGPGMFRTVNIPPTLTALVSLGVIVLAFELTRRLLQSSSHAYRPPPTTMTGWGGWR